MNKYYAILGLPVTASKDEVRRKYRQLVLIWHPDKNSSPGAASKFVQITEAYDILMGERKAPRIAYTTRTYTAPKPKTEFEQRRERQRTKAEMDRRKFEQIRSEYRNARDAELRKSAMYSTSTSFFIAAGLLALVAIAGPIMLGSIVHIVWAMPLGIAGGAQLLWRGGRYKVRADMIFGDRNNFTDEEIREFFQDSVGYRRSSFGR